MNPRSQRTPKKRYKRPVEKKTSESKKSKDEIEISNLHKIEGVINEKLGEDPKITPEKFQNEVYDRLMRYEIAKKKKITEKKLRVNFN